MELGLQGRYYVFKKQVEEEGVIPPCESCGLHPAGSRSCFDLGEPYMQWLDSWTSDLQKYEFCALVGRA